MKKYLLMFGLLSIGAYANNGKVIAEFQSLNGKAGEYVYNKPSDGMKMSQLDWDIKNIPMLKLGYAYEYKNWEFSVTGRKNLDNNYRSGKMKDYDWIPSGMDEEDAQEFLVVGNFPEEQKEEVEANKKENEKIKDNGDGTYTLYYVPTEKDIGKLFSYTESKNYVKNIVGLDLTAKYYLKRNEKMAFAPLFGINYDKYEFYSIGAKGYEYIPGREKSAQESPNVKTITYNQKFLSPYVGIYASYSPNSLWDIEFGIKGSAWGRAKAMDRHHLRGKTQTDEKYKNIKYLSSTLAVKYHWNEFLTLKYEMELTKYFKNKKSTVKSTDEEGDITTIKGSTGLSNKTMTSSLGFEYKF